MFRLHLFFYKQSVYQKLALRWHIAKQFSELNLFLLSSNKNYRLKTSRAFYCNKKCCWIHYATPRKPPSKNVQLRQYVTKKWFFICSCVSNSSFCFQYYFGRPLHGISFPLNYRKGGFFSKKCFSLGDTFWGEDLKGDCSAWRD